jgi:anti-anti-sigma factor
MNQAMTVNHSILSSHEALISVAGEFDAAGCQEYKQHWSELIEQTESQSLILDLSQVTFLDSSGVGAIVFMFKRLKQKEVDMCLSGAQGQVQELLELLRIYQAIPNKS